MNISQLKLEIPYLWVNYFLYEKMSFLTSLKGRKTTLQNNSEIKEIS